MKSLQTWFNRPARSAFADLAESSPDALLGFYGLLLFAAPPLLDALHRGQKPGGFRLTKYHDDNSFRDQTRSEKLHHSSIAILMCDCNRQVGGNNGEW